VWKSIFH
jgi:hypothetical protein